MQHAASGHDDQPFSVNILRHRRETGFGFLEAFFRARPAERKGDRGKRLRDRDRAGQAREESGRGCRFVKQHMIGAFRHRRGDGIRDRDQRAHGRDVRLRAESTLAVE